MTQPSPAAPAVEEKDPWPALFALWGAKLAVKPRRAERRVASLVVVHTGDGKGKTTAAMGIAMRAVGHGRRVAVVQFMKSGQWRSGERIAGERLGMDWSVIGDGFTWDSDDLDRAADIAREAGSLPAPVGYAAVPLSAIWFLDAASNTGVTSAMDDGVIAFVDGSGQVSRFATGSTPEAQLSELARALG